MIEENGREHINDKIIYGKLMNFNYHKKLFTRIGSKRGNFVNVDFSHTYFNHCYFRNCIFESCNFNGCKILNSNFFGSTYISCEFDYTTFQNTLVDEEILDSCSGYDNLKLKFARNLKTCIVKIHPLHSKRNN